MRHTHNVQVPPGDDPSLAPFSFSASISNQVQGYQSKSQELEQINTAAGRRQQLNASASDTGLNRRIY